MRQKLPTFAFGGAARACIFLVGSARETDSIFLTLMVTCDLKWPFLGEINSVHILNYFIWEIHNIYVSNIRKSQFVKFGPNMWFSPGRSHVALHAKTTCFSFDVILSNLE